MGQFRLQQQVVANSLNSSSSIRQLRILKPKLKNQEIILNTITTINTTGLKISTKKPFTGQPGIF